MAGNDREKEKETEKVTYVDPVHGQTTSDKKWLRVRQDKRTIQTSVAHLDKLIQETIKNMFVNNANHSTANVMNHLTGKKIEFGTEGYQLSPLFMQMIFSSPIPTLLKQMFEGAALKIVFEKEIMDLSKTVASLRTRQQQLKNMIAAINEENTEKGNQPNTSLPAQQEKVVELLNKLNTLEEQLNKQIAEYKKQIAICEQILMSLDKALKPLLEKQKIAFDKIIVDRMLGNTQLVEVLTAAHIDLTSEHTRRHMFAVMSAPVPTREGTARNKFVEHLDKLYKRNMVGTEKSEAFEILEMTFGPAETNDVDSDFNNAIRALDAMHGGVEKPLENKVTDQVVKSGILQEFLDLREKSDIEYRNRIEKELANISSEDLLQVFGETDIDDVADLIIDNGYDKKLTKLIAANQTALIATQLQVREVVGQANGVISTAHIEATNTSQSLGIVVEATMAPSAHAPGSGVSTD